MIQIDKKFIDFSLETYLPEKDEIGDLNNKDSKDKWLVLFFYPADFTFVCPTELADLNKHFAEFKKLKTEVVVVSTDTVYTHKAWIESEKLLKGLKFKMAADHNGKVSKTLEIYDENKGLAGRATFIVDPDGILRDFEIVSDNIGRNASELVRKIKALSFVNGHPGLVCPASWDEGDKTIKKSIKKAGKMFEELA